MRSLWLCRSAPISVWRTVFACNEWSELQTLRRTSFEITMLVLILLLVGADLQYVATPQPHATNLTPGSVNPALRFANLVWWYFVVIAVQWLYVFLIGER